MSVVKGTMAQLTEAEGPGSTKRGSGTGDGGAAWAAALCDNCVLVRGV